MRILFVEDNKKFSDEVAPLLREIDGVGSVIVAPDRDSALEIISHQLLDLIVLDLRIPPGPESMAASKEHGQAVFHRAREIARGTPVFILTGSEPDEFSRRLARYGEQLRLWGAPDATETVSYFAKEEIDQLLQRVSELAQVARATDNIDINTRGKELGFSPEENRILRSFARRAGGVSCDIRQLSGGLSGVKVVQATVKDDGGRVLLACAGKLGDAGEIKQEHTAYEKYVKRLKVGAFPTQFCLIDHGVRLTHGIFYTLAEDMEPMFDALKDPARGPEIVKRVRSGLDRWINSARVDEVTVGDIRRRLLSDDKLTGIMEKFDLHGLTEVEGTRVRAKRGVIHGDLHCGNVLVQPGENSVVIDFGDVGQGFSCLDPVTMELSLVFHPIATRNGFSQTLSPQIASWPDLEAYTQGTDLAPTILQCREWAYDVGGGDLDVLAAGYAFAVRQLKYQTIDPQVTLALVKSIIGKIISSR